jgi:hypothetical protein
MCPTKRCPERGQAPPVKATLGIGNFEIIFLMRINIIGIDSAASPANDARSPALPGSLKRSPQKALSLVSLQPSFFPLVIFQLRRYLFTRG